MEILKELLNKFFLIVFKIFGSIRLAKKKVRNLAKKKNYPQFLHKIFREKVVKSFEKLSPHR